MPPIEIGPTRSVGPVQVPLQTPVQQPAPQAAAQAVTATGPATASQGAARIERSPALDPGAAPVDSERVSVIRKAVESGTYPVIPTRIADAMIAAGMLLRSPQA